MKNTIEILREGVYTSIQDLRRTGFKKYGVPKSGPMDEYSHILTNWLLDKKIISELLEITYYGPKIKINFDTKIALCGSKCEVKLNNNKIAIKIDVEGGELGVVNGAINTIHKWKPVVMFENKRKENEKVVDFFTKLGYNIKEHKSDTVAYYE